MNVSNLRLHEFLAAWMVAVLPYFLTLFSLAGMIILYTFPVYGILFFVSLYLLRRKIGGYYLLFIPIYVLAEAVAVVFFRIWDVPSVLLINFIDSLFQFSYIALAF